MKNKVLHELEVAHRYAEANLFDKSIEIYKKILNSEDITDIKVQVHTLMMLAYCYTYGGHPENAVEIYLELNTLLEMYSEDYFKNMFSLSFNYLMMDRWIDGMKYYKYRNREVYKVNLPYTENHLDLLNKNVVVFNEQGLGDEFLFANSLKWLIENTTKLKYQVYPENIEFFKKNYPTVEFFCDRSIDLNDMTKYDIFSYSGTIYSSLYLIEPVFNGLESVNGLKNKKVGVCWKCNPKSGNKDLRSINYDIIKKMRIDYSNIEFVSLQYDLDIYGKIREPFKNMLETSEVIKNLDFIITIDTSIANLSCFLNKKTLILVDKYVDWKWKYNCYNSFEVVNVDDLYQKIDEYYK